MPAHSALLTLDRFRLAVSRNEEARRRGTQTQDSDATYAAGIRREVQGD